MKKITKIILLTILLLGIALTTQVMAVSGRVSVNPSKVEPDQNVEVKVTFNDKVSSAQFLLNYDTSKFEFVSAKSNGSGYGVYNPSNKQYGYMNTTQDLGSVTFTFKAKADGTGKFSVSSAELKTDPSGQNESSSVSGSPSVTIATPTPIPEPDPEPTTPSTPNTPSTPSTQTPSTQTPPKQEETTKEPTFTSVKETVYATSKVNVRSSYSTNSSVLGQLNEGDSVTRIGKGSNGWSKVTYNGKTGYIKASFLTTTKPGETEETENVVNEVTEDVNAVVEEPLNETANELENMDTNITDSELDDNSVMQGSTEEIVEKSNDNLLYIVIGAILAVLVLTFIIFFIVKRKKDQKKEQQNKGWD